MRGARSFALRSMMRAPMRSDMPSDVIVVGIGGMGSATAWPLAERGQRVLGLDRYDISTSWVRPTGSAGSSVCSLMRIRPMRRAYALWRDLETAAGDAILVITGSINGGGEESDVRQGALASARPHDLPHGVLTANAVNERFPACRLAEGMRAVYQPQGGLVAVDRAEEALLAPDRYFG